MWRVIDIAGESYSFHVKNKNIQICNSERQIMSVDYSDVHSIICHGKNNMFSEAFLSGCIANGIPLILCDEKHQPQGMLLQYFQHIDSFSRLGSQINAKLPKRKQAWQQIIKEKINNQASVLEELGIDEALTLRTMAGHVLSGDSSRQEGPAAKIYFSSLFGPGFSRSNDENEINGLLNYAYTIIRSSMARAVVSVGMNPEIGIFHSGNRNPFCLIDDLMEPFRPFADALVLRLINENVELALTPQMKKSIIALSSAPVSFSNQKMEFTPALRLYAMDYLRFISGDSPSIIFPARIS